MLANEGAWLPIRTVAALTGVNAVTLRAWDRAGVYASELNLLRRRRIVAVL